MRQMSILSGLVLGGLLFSCSKEESIENGGSSGGVGNIIGNNCKVNTIIAADSLTGKGLFSLYTAFNSNQQGTRVEAYDSINFMLEAASDLTYKGDTIRVGPNEYFVTDVSKRISKFFTKLDPTDPTSDDYVYNYSYDASGYLKEKTISLAGLPVAPVKFVYTWAGGNLVKVDGTLTLLGPSQKILAAELTYDASKTAKNFIQIMPDAFEAFFFVMTVDIGKKSTNVVKTIKMTTYDDKGNVADIYNTAIKNVKFSSDGYITEWYAEGDGFDPLGIFAGRTIFKYICK